MKEIIERLLTGTGREADALIARAIGWACVMKDPQAENHWYCWRKEYRSGEWMPLPRYTASIDAAMTLVPEGWTVAHITQNDDKSWFVELREGFLTSYTRVVMSPLKTSTPAIALCIAALKARDNG